jgi:hypothetical protein
MHQGRYPARYDKPYDALSHGRWFLRSGCLSVDKDNDAWVTVKIRAALLTEHDRLLRCSIDQGLWDADFLGASTSVPG